MKLEKVLMKTMFKKTLVAAAVIGLSANAFAAVDVVTNSDPVAYSAQTLDGITGTFAVPGENFRVTLGAEYAVGDVITFTFSNGALDTSTLRTTITTTDTFNAGGLPQANVGGSPVTLGLLSTTATSATYRVTEVQGVLSTVGQSFNIINPAATAPADDFALNAAKVKAGNGFAITYAAQTSNGIKIDEGKKSTVQLVYVADQFSVAAKPLLNGVIDVNADRKKFEGGVTTDDLKITTTNILGVDTDADDVVDLNFTNAVAFNKVVYTVKGDFSWVKDTTAADVDSVIVPATATLANTGNTCTGAPMSAQSANVKWAVDKVTIECTAAAAHEFIFDTAQGASVTDPVIPTSSFTYDAKVHYAATKSADYALGLNAGSWTLNGSSVFVPYMVYGTLSGVSFSQVLTVANNSSKAGDIKVDVWAEDGKVLLSNVKVGEAKANATTNIAGAVRTALEGAGLVNGKVSMKITTNVPGKAVTVYSAYTDVASRERAIVNNDSAVQTKGAALN
jgi:hypothetical protein